MSFGVVVVCQAIMNRPRQSMPTAASRAAL
jgi:hypothetical protein